MRIEVFDVGHGHCSVITAPNGRRLMLDCGDRWDEHRFWTPSLHHFGQSVEVLALLNLDEDHLNDFEGVNRSCGVNWILSNPTIGWREFQRLKEKGMGRGAKAFAGWLAVPKAGDYLRAAPDFGIVSVKWWCNRYNPLGLNTTNNLSMVVIVQFGAFKIVFAGDLEAAGWHALLADPSVRLDMIGTNILVASHHGRVNGCYADLFNWMQPEIVIISDDAREHDSQDTDDWYRNRCRGAARIANPSERRYVMTTRNDGSMRIDANGDGRWRLEPVSVPDFPRTPPKPQHDLNWLAEAGRQSNPFANLLDAFGQPSLATRR